MKLIDRFNSKTKWVGHCLEWQNAKTKDGYGHMGVNYRTKLAHHVAWYLEHNEWPKYLLHTCDNPPCVNIKHLREGNQKQNVADMDAKGRRSGGGGGSRNISADLISLIVAAIKSGDTHRQISDKYNVSMGSISNIRKRELK